MYRLVTVRYWPPVLDFCVSNLQRKKGASIVSCWGCCQPFQRRKNGSIIQVDGMSDVLVRFGKCCSPIPGDPIVGFISRGRGITVHTSACEKAFGLDQARAIDVEWSGNLKEAPERITRLRVLSQDIQGLLKSMTEVFSARGVNINNAQIRTTRDKKAICTFDLGIRDINQLNQIIQDLQKIKGILAVSRVSHS